MPPATVVGPEYVLAPLKISVPAPTFAKPIVLEPPAPSVIGAGLVKLPPELLVSISNVEPNPSPPLKPVKLLRRIEMSPASKSGAGPTLTASVALLNTEIFAPVQFAVLSS